MDESVGGAISALSHGTTHPPVVTVTGSLLQGRHAGGGPVDNAGGCIFASGDTNRAPVQITSSVFHDCDIQRSPTAGGGTGGAIDGSLIALQN